MGKENNTGIDTVKENKRRKLNQPLIKFRSYCRRTMYAI